MNPVSPRLATVYRIRAGIAALVLLGFAGAGEILFGPRIGTPGLFLTLWALIVVWLVILRPTRMARSWRWMVDEVDLHVAGGLFEHVHTIVPLGRIQHIDVAQGPLERANGLATVVVHTAGTASTAVALPGLVYDEAVALRDTIRARMADRDE